MKLSIRIAKSILQIFYFFFLPITYLPSHVGPLQKFLGETCPEHTIQQRASAGIRELEGEQQLKQQPQQMRQQQLKKQQQQKQIQIARPPPAEMVPKYKLGKRGGDISTTAETAASATTAAAEEAAAETYSGSQATTSRDGA